MIPEHLCKIIDETISYVGNFTLDWFKIKMEILIHSPRVDRNKFSKRNNSTKKLYINDFEREIIEYWQQKTGNILFINEKKLHPADWVRKPRGHGLITFNEERRKRKENEKQQRKRKKTTSKAN